jgi:hypothetical protein
MPRRLALVCVALALTAVACSGSPPTKERHQADDAIAAARAAGAETYAPDDLRAAEAALQTYDDFVSQRDFRQALNAAMDARDRGYAAAKLAQATRDAARHDATQSIDALDALLTTAAARLSGTSGPHPTAAAADRLKKASASATTTLQEARTLLDHQDYRGASLRVAPELEALRKELGPADAPGGRRGRG